MNKKINIILIVDLILIVGGVLVNLVRKPALGGPYEKIEVIGETAAMGMFDPAVEYVGETGYLVYTALAPPYMHTALAKSTDGGKTWRFVKYINLANETVFNLNGNEIKGMWRTEVATIVYDPDDPGREWKLFSHKYFILAPYGDYKKKLYDDMYIAYKYASSPEELDESEEILLFGTGKSQDPPKYILNQFDSSLEPALGYSEPGSLFKEGVLYLSIASFSILENNRLDFEKCTVFLLASYNHGESWEFVSKLVDHNDAKSLGYNMFSASSLAEENGRVFLLISPLSNMHYGTMIIEFEDLESGKLKRSEYNKLILHKHLKPSIVTDNAGESDYDEANTYGGVVMAQKDNSGFRPGMDPKTVEFFQIFSTKEGLL